MAPKRALQIIFGTQKVKGYFIYYPPTFKSGGLSPQVPPALPPLIYIYFYWSREWLVYMQVRDVTDRGQVHPTIRRTLLHLQHQGHWLMLEARRLYMYQLA